MISTDSTILDLALMNKVWHIFNWYILPSAIFLTLVFLVEWKSSCNDPREPVLCPRHSALYISSCNRRESVVENDQATSSTSDPNVTVDEESNARLTQPSRREMQNKLSNRQEMIWN
nr:uncharacterized protein LOC106686841 isoform X2 [Halyomorpha halys]